MSSNDKTTNIGHITAKNIRDVNSRVKYSFDKDLQKQASAAPSRSAWGGRGGVDEGMGTNSMADDFLNKLLKLEQNSALPTPQAGKDEAELNENEKIDGTNPVFLALKEQEAKKKNEVSENEAGESTFHFVHPKAGEVEVRVKKQGDRFLVYVDMQQTMSLKERHVLGQMMGKILSAGLGKNLEVVIG